jgi:UDP-2,3-diacylglucosamine pyrophosphatase LpxH
LQDHQGRLSREQFQKVFYASKKFITSKHVFCVTEMWLNSQDCNREQCSCSVLPKKKRLVLYNFARCVHENNYSVLTKVSMHEAVEVVHGHLHRRSVSSNTVGRRFQATLNPLTQCNVFYLQVQHNNILSNIIKTTLKCFP